jgi:phosphoglycolate phosphatase
MRYRLVIFDFDGTLADTLPWMRSVFNELADEHGFRKVPLEEHGRFQDLHGSALLKALDLPLWKLPRVVSAMRSKMALHVDQLSLFAGIDEMLRRLSLSGARLAIVSSNSQVNVEKILGTKNTALIQHFACGVSMMGKASRLHAVVRKSGVARENSIYIGDEIRDAEAARKADIAFGAVSWGQHSVGALLAENPAEVFSSIQDLMEKVAARAR